MTGTYILEGKTPVRCDDIPTWARWLHTADRLVGRDEIGETSITTVFLGVDHGSDPETPLLFQTMIFGGKNDGYEYLSSTWEGARNGHEYAVKIARQD